MKLKVLIGVLATLLIVIFATFFYVFTQIAAPDTGIATVFTISTNDSPRTILANLEEEGLIKNDTVAYYYSRLFLNPTYMAGSYELSSDMDLATIIEYVSDAENALTDTVTLTFVEGTWLKEYASILAANTNLSSEDLLAYWSDEEVVRGYMEEYPFLTEDIFDEDIRYYLEGYLFPDTYEFYRETDLDTVTRRFLDRTLTIYEAYADAIAASDLSVHEIFTLASIVQYEASDSENMAMIAGVFYNRLEAEMLLQSSVTVCYAMDIDKDEDSWTACEYNSDYNSPYNTYLYSGLTPGPILNPGEEAIVAVLSPTESNYYYFMADVCGDGTVYYAETFAEHEANVDKYLGCY